jgi:superfamily II DNA or RNA helicase
LNFVEKITVIAAEIKGVPRAEQFVTMFLLATSTHIISLIELPTAFGKALMFGLIAKWLHGQKGAKVAVVVPNEVLATIQQDKYAPWASKVHDYLWREDEAGVFYCTYDDFLTGNIPINTVLLVDEIDSLVFSDAPRVYGGKFLSAIILLNKYKVIGMTATFRGE